MNPLQNFNMPRTCFHASKNLKNIDLMFWNSNPIPLLIRSSPISWAVWLCLKCLQCIEACKQAFPGCTGCQDKVTSVGSGSAWMQMFDTLFHHPIVSKHGLTCISTHAQPESPVFTRVHHLMTHSRINKADSWDVIKRFYFWACDNVLCRDVALWNAEVTCLTRYSLLLIKLASHQKVVSALNSSLCSAASEP